MNSHSLTSTLLICFFINLSFAVFSQENDIITISGEAEVEYPNHKSLNEVKKYAQEQAIVNALEKAFGTIIIEGNSTYAKNIVTGSKVETNSIFNSIGNHWVKGEVIDIIRSTFNEIDKAVIVDGIKANNVKHLNCKVTIKAREIPNNVIDFNLFTLKCLNVNCKSNNFKANDDDFYIYLKSPVSGYFAIYLDDGNISQRLFPYRNMDKEFEQGVPITSNTEYYLFSDTDQHNYFNSIIDEYVFETNEIMEQNRLFAIFSTVPITQPYFEDNVDNSLSYEEKETGWEVPLSLSSEEFQKWLINSRIKNSNIRVQIEDIVIKK